MGEASDNAAAYTSVIGSIGKRAKTTASVLWKPPAWTLGSTYRSSDIKTTLQQIVNRSGWKSGNAAAFIITGTGIREAVAFDGATANAPKLIVTYTYDSAPPAPPPGSTTITKAVAQSADDAEEPNGRDAAVGSTVLELGVDAGLPRVVGMRFSNLSIPVGARIDGAVIEMVAAGSNSDATNLTVVGEAADNAAAYANVAGSISSRLKTGAAVAWSPPAWTAGTTFAYRTGELKSILQEIVSRPGWVSGNAAAFIITGTGARKVTAYEGGATRAPRLVVSYTPATPPPAPLDPAVEAALKTIEASTSFRSLGTALDKQYIVGSVQQEGVSLLVKEQGTDRGFISIVRGDEIPLLFRFAFADTATSLLNVLNGRSSELNVITTYGSESGFTSDAEMKAFAKGIIPMLEDEYTDLDALTLSQQSTLTLGPQVLGLTNNCSACTTQFNEANKALGDYTGGLFLGLLGVYQSLKGKVLNGSTLEPEMTRYQTGGFWDGVLDNVGNVAALFDVYSKFNNHTAKRLAFLECREVHSGPCAPKLVGPSPSSISVGREVGETFTETIVFSNDTSATAPLEFIHNGGNWPGISGPVTGELEPGQQHSIPLQYTCTKAETIDRPIRINTNDTDRTIVDIPVTLTCVSSTNSDISEPTPNPIKVVDLFTRGEEASFSFTNQGGANLTYSVTKSDSGWIVFKSSSGGTVSSLSGTVAPGASAKIDLIASCYGTEDPDALKGIITISSDDVDEPRKEVEITCQAPDLIVEPPYGASFVVSWGDSKNGTFKITNRGNYPTNVSFEVRDYNSEGITPAYTGWLSIPGGMTLPPKTSFDVSLRVNCSDEPVNPPPSLGPEKHYANVYMKHDSPTGREARAGVNVSCGGTIGWINSRTPVCTALPHIAPPNKNEEWYMGILNASWTEKVVYGYYYKCTGGSYGAAKAYFAQKVAYGRTVVWKDNFHGKAAVLIDTDYK